MDFNWFICSYQLFSYEQKREINSSCQEDAGNGKSGFYVEKKMDFMKKLLNCLNYIDWDLFNEDYLNELLDSRDSAPFDTEWCRVNAEIEALKNAQSYTGEKEEEQEKIREKVFSIIGVLKIRNLKGVADMKFPFYDSPDTAAIICCHIMENQAPILYVSHDVDDGM